MKLELVRSIGLVTVVTVVTVAWAASATAGAVIDTDGDRVPDQFDNCLLDDNGPNQATNQIDGDLDGYGNACDSDYNNDGVPNGGDFGLWAEAFNTLNVVIDLTGDGVVNGGDFGPFVSSFGHLPGPSVLPCAGTIPCTP